MIERAEIEAAFVAACHAEIEAPKPGNVHIFGSGHGMTAEHFFVSATAAAGPLCAPGKPVGQRIHEAVAASFAAVGMNTNLGILLLCAPLAAAAERGGITLQAELAKVLEALDVHDTRHVFAAIRLANPGGLGAAARYDVHGVADVTLGVAMAEAAERDRIALQYVTNFNDIFMTGLVALDAAHARGLEPPWSTIAVYLTFLSAFPDSHLLRKQGAAAALETQCEASTMLSLFQAGGETRSDHDDFGLNQSKIMSVIDFKNVERDAGGKPVSTFPHPALADLLAFDERLKSRGRNPGTSADLTVATLFADRLRNILLKPRNDG